MDKTTYNKKQEQYSADRQQSVYLQQQTNSIYFVNMILFFLYYGLLIFYTYYTYGMFRYSNLFYKKLFMIILLFVYPFVIYHIQYGIYTMGRYLVNLVYTNVYNADGW